MDNKEIINKVVEIYFRDSCSVDEAFKKARIELGLNEELKKRIVKK
jgi:hypothetical protein